MSQLGQVEVAAAPACPNCRQRVTDLPLDELANGAEHQCLFCGHFMRIPAPILKKLIRQRDAARAAGAEQPSFLDKIKAFFSNFFS